MQSVLLLFVFLFWGSGQKAQASSIEEMDYEVLAETIIAPFKRELPKMDPLSKKPVDGVLLGPVYKAKQGSDFEYYRYVTFYNVLSNRERFNEWPIQREQCDDDSDLFAGWSKSITYTRSVNASITVEGLGLGASFSEAATVAASRNVKAHGKYITDHVPYIVKEDWEGYTYLQTAKLSAGKETLMLKKQGRLPFWFQILYPRLALGDYPMPFAAHNAEWTLDVEHRKIAKCPASPKSDKSK